MFCVWMMMSVSVRKQHIWNWYFCLRLSIIKSNMWWRVHGRRKTRCRRCSVCILFHIHYLLSKVRHTHSYVAPHRTRKCVSNRKYRWHRQSRPQFGARVRRGHSTIKRNPPRNKYNTYTHHVQVSLAPNTRNVCIIFGCAPVQTLQVCVCVRVCIRYIVCCVWRYVELYISHYIIKRATEVVCVLVCLCFLFVWCACVDNFTCMCLCGALVLCSTRGNMAIACTNCAMEFCMWMWTSIVEWSEAEFTHYCIVLFTRYTHTTRYIRLFRWFNCNPLCVWCVFISWVSSHNATRSPTESKTRLDVVTHRYIYVHLSIL